MLRLETKVGQGWIPACAESTPRLEQKGSGGNDGYKMDSRLRGNDGGVPNPGGVSYNMVQGTATMFLARCRTRVPV